MAKKEKETVALNNLSELTNHLRLSEKKNTLIFAHNGTGKTRLSMAFKDKGKESGDRDTLYFNAFTEDLFSWDNDLDNDTNRSLKFNRRSHFFDGLDGVDMESRIRPFLHRYADFDFTIDYTENKIVFYRNKTGIRVTSSGGIRRTSNGGMRLTNQKIDNIKISRGEENIFVWCFFLAVAQMAIDEDEKYSWVKYLYIDDPISSLDDNNAVAVASHLCQLLKRGDNKLKTVISTHHGIFFNVLHNELKNAPKYFLNKLQSNDGYSLINTTDTPFFHHIVLVKLLHRAMESGKLYTYHFSVLRNVLEKTAAFHGFSNFSECIKVDSDDTDGIIHARRVNILSHGNYSLFEPIEMQEENKEHFRSVLTSFMETYKFNEELFQELDKGEIV